MRIDMTPHEYSPEEVRQIFLEKVWHCIQYWNNLPKDKQSSLEGLAFSILSTLDGESLELPAFSVVPLPHPEDKAFHEKEGSPWFPPVESRDVKNDIGGLHEHFYGVGEEMGIARKDDRRQGA